jgi:hypothetical protein
MVVNKALGMGFEEGRNWLWENAAKERNIYGIPVLKQDEDKKPEVKSAGGKLALQGVK